MNQILYFRSDEASNGCEAGKIVDWRRNWRFTEGSWFERNEETIKVEVGLDAKCFRCSQKEDFKYLKKKKKKGCLISCKGIVYITKYYTDYGIFL